MELGLLIIPFLLNVLLLMLPELTFNRFNLKKICKKKKRHEKSEVNSCGGSKCVKTWMQIKLLLEKQIASYTNTLRRDENKKCQSGGLWERC